MSTTNVPPSYGVSGGPGNEAWRREMSEPPFAASTKILDAVSLWMSASSLAILRSRLEEAMIKFD
jgi:hypothetical protein